MYLKINDFGIKADSANEAGYAFARAVAESQKTDEHVTLTLDKGTYNFYVENSIKEKYFITNTASQTECADKTKHIGILFKNAKNITLDGNGSTLVFHGKFTQIVIDRSLNITIKNLVTDFSRPTMTEMTVIEKTDEYCTLKINDDCSFALTNGRIKWTGPGFEYVSGPTQVVPKDKMSTERTEDFGYTKAELTGNNTVRFYDFRPRCANVSDTVQVRDGIRDEVGFFAVRSKNIVFENVTAHYMHGLGFVGQFSEDITLNGFSAVPNTEKNRTCSCFADSIQISGCRGKVTVTNGVFDGTHDDIMNVHGTFLPVTEIIDDHTVKVRFCHHQTYGFDAFYKDDCIAFVNEQTLLPFAYGTVAHAQMISEHDILLTTKQPIPDGVKEKTAVDNLTWQPEVLFENNIIKRDPTRGILISSGKKTVVKNNRFCQTGMSAVLIACDARSWYESGSVNDVLIENNIFDRCGSPAILICPETERHETGRFVHRNIFITNNDFILSDEHILRVRASDNVNFLKNNIVSDKKPIVTIEHCGTVNTDI